MTLNKREALDIALKRLKSAKNGNNDNVQFDSYEQKYVDYFEFARQDQWVPFRLLGLPWEARKQPTDVKHFLISRIVADSGNWYLPVVWPSVYDSKRGTMIPDPDWILTRFYRDVMDGEWKNPSKEEKQANPNAKGKYIHKYANSAVFERVKENARVGEKYPKPFYPSQRVVANIYDPLDKEFHNTHKRSKVICSRVGQKTRDDGNVTYYPEYGMPLGVYNDIIEIASIADGFFSDFDIAVKLKGKDYRVAHYTDFEVQKVFGDKLSADPIDENLFLYNLDELVPVTRYSTLRKVLGKLFSDWDNYARRDYTDMLNELCEKESAELKEKYDREGRKNPEDTSTVHPVSKPETDADVNKKSESVSSESISYEERFAQTFPGFNSLPEEEQAHFNSVFDGFDENGEPRWKTTETLVPCNGEGGCGKNTVQPSTLQWCSYCGHRFSPPF